MTLAKIRKEKKLTQKEVAQASGLSRVSYCNIENGKRNPSVATAKRIASVLGIDWTMFFACDKSDNVDAFENKQE